MFIKKKKVNILENQLEKLNKSLSESNMSELIILLGNKRKMLIRNLIAGISRGIGIGIGITIITAIILLMLRRIVEWNLPLIGEFVADIVKIVETKT